MQEIQLTERTSHWNENLTVDATARLVKNVALAGHTSRNGYVYTDEALQQAVSLYLDKPVFLDHARDRQRPHDRSTRDLVGSIVNPRYENGRIRGDIRVLETESGEMFLKLVEAETPGVGMSHVVLAQRSEDGRQVERIIDVISVDVVFNPATTSTFRESFDPEIELQREQWEQLLTERDSLRSELSRLREELAVLHERDAVDQLLKNSGLPQEAVTECFREQLLNSRSMEMRHQLIHDRLALLSFSSRSQKVPQSFERESQLAQRLSDEPFLRAIRRQ